MIGPLVGLLTESANSRHPIIRLAITDEVFQSPGSAQRSLTYANRVNRFVGFAFAHSRSLHRRRIFSLPGGVVNQQDGNRKHFSMRNASQSRRYSIKLSIWP